VTPPVALAAFAAAAIARSNTMQTSIEAWKYAKGLYMVPLYFVFNHELIMGGPLHILLWDAALLTLSLVAFAAIFESFLFTWMRWPARIIMTVGMVLLFFPQLSYELTGAVLVGATVVGNYLAARRTAPALSAA